MKLNMIYNMDCLEGMKQLEDGSVDLIIADPPYNIGKAAWDKIDEYVGWCRAWILECQRKTMEYFTGSMISRSGLPTHGNDTEGYGVSVSLFLYLGQG